MNNFFIIGGDLAGLIKQEELWVVIPIKRKWILFIFRARQQSNED